MNYVELIGIVENSQELLYIIKNYYEILRTLMNYKEYHGIAWSRYNQYEFSINYVELFRISTM